MKALTQRSDGNMNENLTVLLDVTQVVDYVQILVALFGEDWRQDRY